MDNLDYILQSNLYPLLVLGIVFINLKLHKDFHVRESRSFKAIIYLTAFLLLSEIVIYFSSQGATPVHIFFNNFFNVLNFIALPATAFAWVIYILRESNFEYSNYKWLIYVLIAPLLITMVLATLSAFFGLYFIIDSANVYTRGPLFFIHAIISYSYLLVGIFFIIQNRKKLPKGDLFPMLLFALPPSLGGLLQMAFYGTLLINPGLVLSILLIFIFNQNQRVVTDYLTGLNNRRQYEKYIAQLRPKTIHNTLAVMSIDLDNFKQINDNFGHFLGDDVLISIAKILHDTFKLNDFIARTGGDEFYVFFQVGKKRPMNQTIKRFIDNLNDFNSQQNFPFDIKCSYGVDIYNRHNFSDIRSFLTHIDRLMYLQKGKDVAVNLPKEGH